MATDIIARALAANGGGGGGEPVDAYTKAETNDLLATKADKNTSYTKTEVNNLLAEKEDNILSFDTWAEYNAVKDTIPADTYFVVKEDEQANPIPSHNSLMNRDANECHPINAITGLQAELDKKTDVTDTDVLKARMDQLVGTVPPGSADEIADARVMADGKTSQNLGDAIRTQVSGLKETIANINGDIEAQDMFVPHITADEFTIGKILRNNEVSTNMKASATLEYYDIRNVSEILWAGQKKGTDGNNFNFLIHFYDATKTYINEQTFLTGGSVKEITIPENARYIRMSFYYGSSATSVTEMTMNDIAPFFAMSFTNKKIDEIYAEITTADKFGKTFLAGVHINKIGYEVSGNDIYISIPNEVYLRGAVNKAFKMENMGIETVESPSGIESILVQNNYVLCYNFITDTFSIEYGRSGVIIDEKTYIILAFVNSGSITGGLFFDYYLNRNSGGGETGSYIPDYWNDAVTSGIAGIRTNMESAGMNGFTFAYLSDYHTDYNQQHSADIMAKIMKYTNIDVAMCGGDLIQHGNKASQKKLIYSVMDKFKSLPNPLHMVFGNHDDNSNNNTEENYFSKSEVYSMMFSQMKDVTYFTDKFDYYFEDEKSSTVIIGLDTGTKTTSWSTSQANALDTLLTENEDKHVIIFGHILFSLTEYGGYTQNLTRLESVIANHSNVVAVFSGHTHYDYSIRIAGNVPVIVIDTDSTNVVADNPNAANPGTTTEHCMDFVTVDYDNSVINCQRVGRGSNRVFDITL